MYFLFSLAVNDLYYTICFYLCQHFFKIFLKKFFWQFLALLFLTFLPQKTYCVHLFLFFQKLVNWILVYHHFKWMSILFLYIFSGIFFHITVHRFRRKKSKISNRVSLTQVKNVYMYMILNFSNVIRSILEFLK